MRRWILCIIGLLWITKLVGCATHPPPEILPEKATNFEYQYSVAVPQDWAASENLPKEYEDSIPQFSMKMLSLVMVNRESRGVIVIINEKLGHSYRKIMDAPLDKLQELPQMVKAGLEEKIEVLRFDSNVDLRSLYETDRNYKASPSSYRSEPLCRIETDLKGVLDDYTLGYDWFAYPCHKSNTCFTIVMLATRLDYFDKNRTAFNAVSKSLTMHDVPDN